MSRIFLGVQPTGDLHPAIIVSARIRNFVGLQDEHECIYCVVDCTRITVLAGSRGRLGPHTREVASAFLASGHRPEDPRSIFIRARSRPTPNWLGFSNWWPRVRVVVADDPVARKRPASNIARMPSRRVVCLSECLMAARYTVLTRPTSMCRRRGPQKARHLELTRDNRDQFNNEFRTDFFPPCRAAESLAKDTA